MLHLDPLSIAKLANLPGCHTHSFLPSFLLSPSSFQPSKVGLLFPNFEFRISNSEFRISNRMKFDIRPCYSAVSVFFFYFLLFLLSYLMSRSGQSSQTLNQNLDIPAHYCRHAILAPSLSSLPPYHLSTKVAIGASGHQGIKASYHLSIIPLNHSHKPNFLISSPPPPPQISIARSHPHGVVSRHFFTSVCLMSFNIPCHCARAE